jgi:hypothetical protein
VQFLTEIFTVYFASMQLFFFRIASMLLIVDATLSVFCYGYQKNLYISYIMHYFFTFYSSAQRSALLMLISWLRPLLYPPASRFAGALHAAVQVFDGGGARVRVGEVLNEGGAGLFPRVDVVRGKGIEPLAIRYIQHEGLVARGKQLGVMEDAHRHGV